MIKSKKLSINLAVFLIALIGHALLMYSSMSLSFNLNDVLSKNDQPISLKIRQIGKENSKKKEMMAIPSKKSEESNPEIFKKFQMSSTDQVADLLSNKSSSIKKNNERVSRQNMSIRQARIMEEVKSEKRDENPLLNHTNYHIKFEPPNGIEMDQLNELEKVFYSFFRRASLQYVTSVNRAINNSIEDTPYIKSILKNHGPIELKARIRYDKEGNAEVVKILNSSNEKEVALMFEKILAGMTKIPNIAKQIQDKDGNMTMFYQFNINKN